MNFPTRTGLIRGVAALLIAVAASMAVAQDAEHPKQQAEPKAIPFVELNKVTDKGALRLLPPDSVTRHPIETASGPIAYTATAGTLSLYDRSGERTAAVFYTAYVADRGTPARRPVTFVFNGGPGAASAYPASRACRPARRRLRTRATRRRRDATARQSAHLAAFTDLVMIDPVGSGFSRPAKADGGKAFWSVASDANSMAKVISLWLANNHRSDSPKFILGESYGGFRAAKVGRALRKRPRHRSRRHRDGVAADGGCFHLRRHALCARRRHADSLARRRRARAEGRCSPRSGSPKPSALRSTNT